jgi:hypothetical protein
MAMFARSEASSQARTAFVGKWRVYVLLEGKEIVAYQIDNRGEAY